MEHLETFPFYLIQLLISAGESNGLNTFERWLVNVMAISWLLLAHLSSSVFIGVAGTWGLFSLLVAYKSE
jgi:hypothetical protein